MNEQSNADAVVIGAGVIGAGIAYELGKRGLRAVVVERLSAAGHGSTSASSAVVRFNYSTRAGVAMSYEGLQIWRRWADYVNARADEVIPEFVSCGLLFPKADGGNHELSIEHFDDLGVLYEDLDGATIIERFGYIDGHRFGPPARMDDDHFWADPAGLLEGALWMPEAGYVSDPMLAAQNLAVAAERCGVRVLYNAEVVAITQCGGRVSGVDLADGSHIGAPIVVNAAGPHSGMINALADVLTGMRITTRPMRREVFVVPAPPQLDFEAVGCAISDVDTGMYLRPERGNNILIGGVESPCDELEWVDDPDSISQAVRHDEFQTHVLRAARRVKGLGIPHESRGMAGVYDVSDDWIPIYDCTDLGGFFVAIGTSGNQFKNAGIVGHCMAELIVAVTDGHDHDADPIVIRGPSLGLPIEMATFSRRRTPNENSSMSVFA